MKVLSIILLLILLSSCNEDNLIAYDKLSSRVDEISNGDEIQKILKGISEIDLNSPDKKAQAEKWLSFHKEHIRELEKLKWDLLNIISKDEEITTEQRVKLISTIYEKSQASNEEFFVSTEDFINGLLK